MIATFTYHGDTIDFVADTDCATGSVVVHGTLTGICSHAIPAGHLGALQLTGVFDIVRETGEEMTTGTRLFWDESNQRVSADDNEGARPYIGTSIKNAAANDPTICMRLNH